MQPNRAAGTAQMELTEDDVLEILKLFEQSKFDFLHLQQGERQITVSKAGYVPAAGLPQPARPTSAAPQTAPTSRASAPAAAPAAAGPTSASETAVPEGLVPITAPMVGKF